MPRLPLVLLTLALILTQACVRAGFSSSSELRSPDGGPEAAADDALGDAPSDGPLHDGTGIDGPSSAKRTLYIALEGNKASYVRTLAFDPVAPTTVALTGPPLRLDGLTGGAVRGLARRADGTFLAGSGFKASAQRINKDGSKLLGVLNLNNGSAPANEVPANLHGICVLPNGHLIVGEYSGGSGNAVAEYTLSPGGGTASFLRPVHAAKLGAGTVTHCVGPTNSELYLTELNANTDDNGDLVRLTYGSSSWTEVGRLDTTSLDAAQGSAKTAIYTFVQHTDGALYSFPLRRFGSQIKKLIRCTPPDLKAADCTLRGVLPPDPSNTPNGPGTLNVALELPGSTDMLFATNSRLYRYKLASDTYVELMNLAASFTDLKTSSGQADGLKQVRGLLVSN